MAKTIEQALAGEWERYHAPPLRRLTEHEREKFAKQISKDRSIEFGMLPDWSIKELYEHERSATT